MCFCICWTPRGLEECLGQLLRLPDSLRSLPFVIFLPFILIVASHWCSWIDWCCWMDELACCPLSRAPPFRIATCLLLLFGMMHRSRSLTLSIWVKFGGYGNDDLGKPRSELLGPNNASKASSYSEKLEHEKATLPCTGYRLVYRIICS